MSATWDAVEGATSYRLRWRQSGGEFEAANAATVSGANATVTVTAYGQWEVRVKGCNDDGCGPEAGSTASVTEPPAGLRVGPVLDARGRVVPGKIAVTWDPVPDATGYMLNLQSDDTDSQAVGQGSASVLQARAGSGAAGQMANVQGASRLILPADQTSAEFTLSGEGTYNLDMLSISGNGRAARSSAWRAAAIRW